MILGVGIDIVKNSRFYNKTEGFFLKLFLPCEFEKILSCISEEKKAEKAASLFALKEATSKAIGESLFDIGIKSIRIDSAENKPPKVVLDPYLIESIKYQYNVQKINIFSSISHEREYSVAYSIIEGFYEK